MPKITVKGKGLKVTVESAEAQVSALSPVSSADSFVVVGASSSPSREPEPLTLPSPRSLSAPLLTPTCVQSASRVSKGSPTSSSAPSYSGGRFLRTAPPFLSSDSSVPECPLHGLEPSTQDRPVTAIPGYILDLSRRLGSSFRPTKLFLAFCRTEGRFLTLFLRELKPRRILPGPTSPIPADGVLGACASLGRSGGVIGVRLASRLKTVRKSVCVCVCAMCCWFERTGSCFAFPSTLFRTFCSGLWHQPSGLGDPPGQPSPSCGPSFGLTFEQRSLSQAFGLGNFRFIGRRKPVVPRVL